nr:glycosyltransferase [Thermoleophilaceae bacterium]
MHSLRVAVTTHSPAAVLDECLGALAGARGILVLSGPGARCPARLPEGFTVEREPRPGASHARNRALAACEDGEIVAYVDDDAVPDPEFLGTMSAIWQDEGPDVACVAGRIELRLPGPAPEWFAPELRTVFSELDLGPEPKDLDPAVNFAYGPNMSFRAGALRAAGGFDPALGPGPGRPGFAEEQEAQLALVRLGHRVRWEPAPRVEHVVSEQALT